MNLTATPSPMRTVNKRSAYSHSGCVHCKKLRQKCDEKKPSCTACLNQSQECVYNQCIVMWTPQKKRQRKPKGAGAHTAKQAKAQTSTPPQDTGYYNNSSSSSSSSQPVHEQQRATLSMAQHLPPPPVAGATIPEVKIEYDDSSWGDDSSYSYSSGFSPSLTVDDLFFADPEIKQAVQDYREVPVPASHQVMVDENEYLNVPVLDDPPSPISDSVLLKIPQWTEYSFHEWDRIMSAYRPSSFTTEQDLQRFLEHAFLRTKCTFIYPFGSDDSNPLWRGMMEAKGRHDFLRYAMLTATCNILELHCKCSEWQPYKRKYMDLCMESLILKVSSYRTDDEITALFATSMILCSDKSSSSSDKWRVHLRGALDLLQASSESNIPSDLHVTTRSWFAMADTLAWLSAPGGGVSTKDANEDVLDDTAWVYMTEGIVIDGFNTIRGYSQLLVPHMTRAARLMMEKRKYGFYAGDQDVLYSTLSEVAILERQEFSLATVSEPIVAQSMRVSHTIHCKALQLYVRVRLFESYLNCTEVQSLTNSLLELLQSYPLRQSLGITIHWAAFVTGRTCITIEQRSVIEQLLVEMINVGLKAARNSLHRLLRYWEKYDEGEYDFDTNDLDSLAT